MPIPVAFAINDPYLKPLLVVLVSMFEHAHADTVYAVYVLNYKLKAHTRQKIEELINERHPQSSVTFLDFSDEQWGQIPLVNGWAREVNYRLFLPELVPHLDKILYLDVDTLVMCDLGVLHNIDLDGNAFAAGREPWVFYEREAYFQVMAHLEGRNETNVYLGQDVARDSYINSGVLVINLVYWRQHKFMERALNLLQHANEQFIGVSPDQDILNYLAIDNRQVNIYILPLVFNWFNQYEYIDPATTRLSLLKQKQHAIQERMTHGLVKDEQLRAIKEPQIWHYAGKAPWKAEHHRGGHRELYQAYADKIGWKLPSHFASKVVNFKLWIKTWGKKEWALAIMCFSLGAMATGLLILVLFLTSKELG
jgi:lipopolysaccharide biosynthesis glycosyltransferase